MILLGNVNVSVCLELGACGKLLTLLEAFQFFLHISAGFLNASVQKILIGFTLSTTPERIRKL